MSRLRGECISPGIAVGPVALRGFDAQQTSRRIAADEVEGELNRLREALDKSRAQIEEIKQKQGGTLGEAELRIFDAHLAYLADAVFVTEIEAQVMNERLPVREADLPRPRFALASRAIRPAPAEVAANPRARSAVLRVAERTA